MDRLETFWLIAVEPDGNLVVVDTGLDAVVRIDPVTGDRTIVSDKNTGSGTDFILPGGISVDPEGNIFVIDAGQRLIIRVNSKNGDRIAINTWY